MRAPWLPLHLQSLSGKDRTGIWKVWGATAAIAKLLPQALHFPQGTHEHLVHGSMQKETVEDTEIRCSTACFCCILQRGKKPLQGQTATAKLRMKTHSPVTVAFLHTQKPQLLAFSCSCCRGITEEKSASGVLTAQVGLGLGGSHWSDSHSHGPALAHTALQSHRGSKPRF